MVIEKKQIITPAQRNRDRLSKGLSQFEYITQRQVLEKKSKEAAKQLDQQIKGFNFTNVNQVIELFNKIPSNIKKYMTIDKDKLMASVADKQAKTFNSISQFKSFYSSLPESVRKNMSVNENYLINKREETINKIKYKLDRWKEKEQRYDDRDDYPREKEAEVMIIELENLLRTQLKDNDKIIDYDRAYDMIREKARQIRREKEAKERYKKKVKEYNDKLKEIENLMSKKAIKRIEYKDNVPTKFYTDEGKVIDLKSFSKDTRKSIDKAYTSYITETAKAKKDWLKQQESKFKKLEKDFQVALAGAKLGFNTLNKYQTSKFTPEQQAKIYEAYKETVKPKFEKFKDMFAPNKKFYTDATNEILYRQAINSNAKILNKVNPDIKPIPFGSDIKKFNELNKKINDYIQKLEDINKKVQKSVSLDLKKKAENITNKVLTGQSITPNQYKEYEKEILKRMKDRSIKQQELIASFVLAPDKYSLALKKRKELGEKHPLLNDIKKVGKFTADVLGRSVIIAVNDAINFLYLLYGVKGIPKNLKGESYDGLVAKATRNLLEYEQDVIRSEKPFEKVKNDAKKLAKASVIAIGKTTDKVIDAAEFAKKHPKEAAALTVVGGIYALGKVGVSGANVSENVINLVRRNPKEALAQTLSFFVPGVIIKAGNKLYKGARLITKSKLLNELKILNKTKFSNKLKNIISKYTDDYDRIITKYKVKSSLTKGSTGIKLDINAYKGDKLIKGTGSLRIDEKAKKVYGEIKLGDKKIKINLNDKGKYYEDTKLNIKIPKKNLKFDEYYLKLREIKKYSPTKLIEGKDSFSYVKKSQRIVTKKIRGTKTAAGEKIKDIIQNEWIESIKGKKRIDKFYIKTNSGKRLMLNDSEKNKLLNKLKIDIKKGTIIYRHGRVTGEAIDIYIGKDIYKELRKLKPTLLDKLKSNTKTKIEYLYKNVINNMLKNKKAQKVIDFSDAIKRTKKIKKITISKPGFYAPDINAYIRLLPTKKLPLTTIEKALTNKALRSIIFKVLGLQSISKLKQAIDYLKSNKTSKVTLNRLKELVKTDNLVKQRPKHKQATAQKPKQKVRNIQVKKIKQKQLQKPKQKHKSVQKTKPKIVNVIKPGIPEIPKPKIPEKVVKFKIPKLPKPSPSSPKRKSYQVRFYDGNKLKVVTPNTAPLKRAANFARKFIKKNKSKINRYLLVEVGTTRIPDVTKTIYDNDFAGTIKNARLIKR